MKTIKRYLILATALITAAIASAASSGTLEAANGIWAG